MEMPKAQVRCHLISKYSQEHGNYDQSVHMNINVDSNTYYDALEMYTVHQSSRNQIQV